MTRHATRQLGRFDAQRFAAKIKARGYTQEGFARALDVGVRNVQRWTLGEGEPSGWNLVRAAALLECEPSSFYADAEEAA
jgi:transcriptional regulator with XRE-family HTH domain